MPDALTGGDLAALAALGLGLVGVGSCAVHLRTGSARAEAVGVAAALAGVAIVYTVRAVS